MAADLSSRLYTRMMRYLDEADGDCNNGFRSGLSHEEYQHLLGIANTITQIKFVMEDEMKKLVRAEVDDDEEDDDD